MSPDDRGQVNTERDKMRIGDYRTLLEKALPARKKLLIVGPQGIGKTQIPEELCSDWGWDCFSLCMPMIDPPFLMGYPFRENGTAGHLPFGVMADALKATKDTLIVLDEIGGASETVIKAGLRFLQFGEVAGKRLPECVRVIALSNDVSHGAAVMGMVEPAKSRFDSIINVEPHIDDTITYGLSRGWPTWLLAYLRNAPDALYDYKPCKSMQIGGADPRGWERVAQWDLDGFLNGPAADELVCGRVGKGRGVQALAFREMASQLPDVDQCLMDPDSAPVPENPAARYLVSMAISGRISDRNFGAAVRYLNRMPQMFRAFSIRDAFRSEAENRKKGKLPKDYRAIASSRDFTAWAVSQGGLIPAWT